MAPLDRLKAFIDDAQAGMARHDFRRGCLIGNLGQEMAALPEGFRERLNAVFEDWERRLARCLEAAQREARLFLLRWIACSKPAFLDRLGKVRSCAPNLNAVPRHWKFLRVVFHRAEVSLFLSFYRRSV